MLLEADFSSHMYPEIIAAIQRDELGLIDKAIAAAEQEAKGYMSRYDIDTMFAAAGDARDPMLMMYLKDIAVWHFVVLANPNMNVEFMAERHSQAIRQLEKIQAGKVVPYGWPPATDTEGADTFFHVKSADKRETRY